MVVAADSDEARKREVEHLSRHAEDHGLALVWRQDGMRERPDREHFGSETDLSAGDLRPDRTVAPNKPDEGEPPQHLIAPGEFVLGYLLRGRSTASVTAPYPPIPAAGFPNPPLELTRHGSYLVLRRLRQDVKGFGTS